MKTLREYIKEAEEKKVALGHFNVSNLEALKGIYQAAQKLNLPIIIGVSEGEEEFIGREEIVSLIKTIRERDNYPIFLNADHHYTFESVQKALDVGYDSVIIDGVKLSLEENIILTKKCVDYARELSKKENRDILVEAEIGFIGISSKLLDTLPEGISAETMTKPEDAKYFVEKTGVDLLAPSVGNVHGMIKSGNPKLNIELIKKIREISGVPLVLHGGSGISDEDFSEAIKAGISTIHINTEIRLAYRDAVRKFLIENPDEIAPYKILRPAITLTEEVVEKRLKLFNGII
jgi:fructose-bisphosphate aldolase class II